MFARILIFPVLGLLALGATNVQAAAGCSQCRAHVAFRRVVVKHCGPALHHAAHKRRIGAHRRRLHASGHIAYGVPRYNPCPTGYDKFGYACGIPVHIPQPTQHDASYGIGYRP